MEGGPPDWKFSRSATGRIPVFSAGAALRANLFGYIVMQVFCARPFQRPEVDDRIGFLIASGW